MKINNILEKIQMGRGGRIERGELLGAINVILKNIVNALLP